MNTKKALIIGAGQIAQEYIKILLEQNLNVTVVCRKEAAAEEIKKKYSCQAFSGGVEKYLEVSSDIFDFAINAVPIEKLFETNLSLINSRLVKKILSEKPGAISKEQFFLLSEASTKNCIPLYIAYNRRFFSSHLKLIELLQTTKITSIDVEFTEWFFKINPDNYAKEVLKEWFLANSSHVIDMALNIGGKLKSINSIASKNFNSIGIPEQYAGFGEFESGAILSFHADWNSAGRWKIEISTPEGRYLLCPLEKLFFQKKGQLNYEEILFDDSLDKKWKPGFYLGTLDFLNGSTTHVKSLEEQINDLNIFNSIKGF